MKTLLKNGIIVTDDFIKKSDLLIEDEKILAIGDFDGKDFDKVYDVDGKYVMPGLIDAHTHMELQQSEKYRSLDDFYTGTIAAAVGGTTTIIDHMAFGEDGANLHNTFDTYTKLGKKSVIDYAFHGVFQRVDDDILKELKHMVEEEGVLSFKGYSTYGYALSDIDFYRIFLQMKESNGLLTIHSENDEITNYLKEKFIKEGKTDPIYHALSRPNQAEAETVDTMLNLAKLADDAPVYIVHTSTKEAIDRIKLAKDNGQKNVFCETCTQYLTLTDQMYYKDGKKEGLKYLMAPPLRKKKDNEALWLAIKDGYVDTIATDHCPFTLKEKNDGIDDFSKAPGGAPGVEERVRVIFSEGVMKGRISLNKFVEVMSTNPAKIFGLYPQKGSLVVGSDADITVIDPNKKEILKASNMKGKSEYSPYENMEVKGSINLVFVRGKLVAKDNEFLGEKGYGKWLYRKRDFK
ncbi:MAG: dihydropyrimidinase [Tissierellia bacterium]|nr:dihydropyrimidinase [Tissierellia bacterium]